MKRKSRYLDPNQNLHEVLGATSLKAAHEKKPEDMLSDITAKKTIIESVKKNWMYQRQNSHRHSLEKTEIEAEHAFGGSLNIQAATNAFQIVELYEANTSLDELADITAKDMLTIREQNQKLNMLLVIYGISLTNNYPELFDFAVEKLGSSI